MPQRIYIAILVFALGCDSQEIPERDSLALLQTEALAYQLVRQNDGLSTEITYTFENRTGATVYIANCNGSFNLTLEREENDTWKPIWYPFLQACLSPPIVIEVGQTFKTTLNLWGAFPDSNAGPQFESQAASGIYRLVWISAFSSYQSEDLVYGDELELGHRISNKFYIEVE